jgi:hypothetical protein
MGILPMQFKPGDTRKSLGLKGDEIIDIAASRRRDQAFQDLRRRSIAPTAGSRTSPWPIASHRQQRVSFKSGGIPYVLNNPPGTPLNPVCAAGHVFDMAACFADTERIASPRSKTPVARTGSTRA